MGRLFGSVAIAVSVTIGVTAGLTAGFAASASASEDAGLTARGAPVSVAPGAGAVPGAGFAPGAGAAAGQPRSVILINGDRLLAGAMPGGATAHMLMAGTAHGAGGALTTTTVGGRAYVIPADALPYLGRGLNADLFGIAGLLREQAGGRLPVEVRYAGRVPSLPGVTITSASGGTGRGYLTAASARTFGAALARQFAADHARGSYGRAGLFAGGVSLSLPGAAARPAARHFPMGTLTINGTNLAGKPDTGDQVILYNADNSTRFADPIASVNVFYKDATRFSVPSGHYWAVGMFPQFAG
jgi:hypothetical protein